MTHRDIDIDPPPRPTMTSPNLGEAAVTTTDRPPPTPPPPDASAPPDRESNRPMLITVIVLAVAVTAGLIAAVALTLNRDTPQFPNTTAASTAQQNPPSPSAQETPTATATPTIPTLTPEEQAVADAEIAYRKYLALDDQLSSMLPHGGDYGAYERAFSDVAIGVALTEAAVAAGDLAASGQRTAGQTGIAALEVDSIKLETGNGLVPEVVFDACVDYSGVDVIASNGESVKDPTGPNRYLNRVVVREYPELGGWLVAERQSDGTTC
jgi:hypothetical protein